MPESPTPVTRGLSPWWSLLLLPVCLLIGWLLGQLPSPTSRASRVAARQGGSTVSAPAVSPTRLASATVEPPTAAAESQGGGGTGFQGFDPAPAEVEKPARETPRVEYSQWTTLENAMAESQRNGKPVLIDFNAEWCGPCRAMKQQVFDDPLHGQAVQSAVIPVSIVDRMREEGRNPLQIENLQQRFQVDAFPTLVVFSPETGRIMRTQGFGGAEPTVAWITQAAQAVR